MIAFGFGVEEDSVVFFREPFAVPASWGVFVEPDYFVQEILSAADRVHHQFQVVAGSGVAVQVDAACVFEQSAHFCQPWCHVDEV